MQTRRLFTQTAAGAAAGMVLTACGPKRLYDVPKERLKTAIADQLRPLFMNSRERRFFRAVRSGERKAAELLSNGH